jgi:hypothetical protein
MTQLELIELRRQRLKAQIASRLDLLIGSVHKTPSQSGYHLTAKAEGKSVTKYVRKELVPQAKEMTGNHLQVRKLLRQLSALNWRWLQLQDQSSSR